ncbi:MAG: NAD(P)H-dependent oxidoreductase [Burkholderiales bacterium]|nr:NAD(P)H-dependent oxidoreductase [Burkholderiales bacterium]
MTVKIVVFAGSARKDSLNKKLARVAAESVRAAGATATFVDLADYPIPLYDGDLEARDGLPVNARKLKDLFIAHQGLLIVSPENNASISSLLKNTLDWISRQDGKESGLVPYQGKVAAIAGASPGALGGLRGLTHLRAILQNLRVLVLSEQFALDHADAAFDADGKLKDAKHLSAISALAKRLVDVSAKLAS